MKRLVMVLAATTFVLGACSRNDGRSLRPPSPDQTQSILTTTTRGTATTAIGSGDGSAGDASDPSESRVDQTATILAPWLSGEAIPALYTCRGSNQAPTLTWTGMEPGAVEQAVVMTDVTAAGFVHWIVAGIPPEVGNIDPLHLPAGSVVGQNSNGAAAYTGPCPPSGRHTYLITLYELSAPSGVTAAMAASDAVTAIKAAQVEMVSVSGQFG